MAKIVEDTNEILNKHQLKKEDHLKRVRLFVIILSLVLFVICLYDIYVSFTSTSDDVTSEDIKWRFRTIVRTLVSLFGYTGAILCHKRLLVAVMALIMIDLILTFGVYYLTHEESKSKLSQLFFHNVFI